MATKYEYISLKEFNALQPCYYGMPIVVTIRWDDGRETEHKYVAPAGRIRFRARRAFYVEKIRIPKTAQLSQADEKSFKEEFEEDFLDDDFNESSDWKMESNGKY